MPVGMDEGQSLVHSGVVFGGHQGVLQAVAVGGVVMHVVGGDQGDADLAAQADQFPVAPRVALEEVLLQFHEHRILAEPVQVVAQQPQGIVAAVFSQQPVQRPAPSSGEQSHSPGVLRQMPGVQPGLPAVGGVGQGEEAGNVGVALPGPGQ